MVRKLVFETVIPCSVEDLWAFHGSVEALNLLCQPGMKIEIIGDEIAVENGAVHKLRFRKNGIPIYWEAEISEVMPPNQFVDTARRSPFKYWQHRHEFLPHAEGALLRDTVTYELPFGFIGKALDSLLIRKDIEKLFAFRHQVTKQKQQHPTG